MHVITTRAEMHIFEIIGTANNLSIVVNNRLRKSIVSEDQHITKGIYWGTAE